MFPESEPGSLFLLDIAKLPEQALILSEEMLSLVLHVRKSSHFAQQVPFGVLKLCPERISLLGERVIVSNQSLNIFKCSLELEGESFEFVFVHPELVTAGFERSRVTEPIVGVFYIEGIHGYVLLNTVCI